MPCIHTDREAEECGTTSPTSKEHEEEKGVQEGSKLQKYLRQGGQLHSLAFIRVIIKSYYRQQAEFATEESKRSKKNPIICNHVPVSQWGTCAGRLGMQTCGFRPTLAPDWVANEGLR